MQGNGEKIKLFDESDEKVEALTEKVKEIKIQTPKSEKPVKKKDLKSSFAKVCTSLDQWYTIDSFRTVFGDEYVREVLKEQDCSSQKVFAAVGDDNLTEDFRTKYIQLCRNLDIKDAEDKDWDESELGVTHEPRENSEKSPYEKIREDAEVERLKISSYFKGKTEFEQEVKSVRKKGAEIQEQSTQFEPKLPLVDKYAQGALRRRVVHDQLDRV